VSGFTGARRFKSRGRKYTLYTESTWALSDVSLRNAALRSRRELPRPAPPLGENHEALSMLMLFATSTNRRSAGEVWDLLG